MIPATPTYPTADILIFYGTAALAVVTLAAASAAAVWAYGKVRDRRNDRAWAAGTARIVREREAEIAHLNQLYAMESAGERP